MISVGVLARNKISNSLTLIFITNIFFLFTSYHFGDSCICISLGWVWTNWVTRVLLELTHRKLYD